MRNTEDGCISCLEVKKRMPSINRIRVNNVKYNFGTQQYDDFTMRMYGKNTLYDRQMEEERVFSCFCSFRT